MACSALSGSLADQRSSGRPLSLAPKSAFGPFSGPSQGRSCSCQLRVRLGRCDLETVGTLGGWDARLRWNNPESSLCSLQALPVPPQPFVPIFLCSSHIGLLAFSSNTQAQSQLRAFARAVSSAGKALPAVFRSLLEVTFSEHPLQDVTPPHQVGTSPQHPVSFHHSLYTGLSVCSCAL